MRSCGGALCRQAYILGSPFFSASVAVCLLALILCSAHQMFASHILFIVSSCNHATLITLVLNTDINGNVTSSEEYFCSCQSVLSFHADFLNFIVICTLLLPLMDLLERVYLWNFYSFKLLSHGGR